MTYRESVMGRPVYPSRSRFFAVSRRSVPQVRISDHDGVRRFGESRSGFYSESTALRMTFARQARCSGVQGRACRPSQGLDGVTRTARDSRTLDTDRRHPNHSIVVAVRTRAIGFSAFGAVGIKVASQKRQHSAYEMPTSGVPPMWDLQRGNRVRCRPPTRSLR